MTLPAAPVGCPRRTARARRGRRGARGAGRGTGPGEPQGAGAVRRMFQLTRGTAGAARRRPSGHRPASALGSSGGRVRTAKLASVMSPAAELAVQGSFPSSSYRCSRRLPVAAYGCVEPVAPPAVSRSGR